MSIQDCVGYTMADIPKIKNEHHFVLLPGLLRIRHPEADNHEVAKMAMYNDNPFDIDEAYKKQRDYDELIKSSGIGDGYKYSLSLTGTFDIKVKMISFSFRERVKSRIKRMMEECDEAETDEDYEEIVEQISKVTGSRSERSTIHQVANLNNFPVQVNELINSWEVKPKLHGPTTKATTVRGQRETIVTWVKTLDVGEPTKLPNIIRESVSDTYLRTILSSLNGVRHYSYRRGAVTKYRGVLRDDKLYVDGELVGTCKSRRMLEMLLLPMSLEPKDILNPRAPRIGSDSSCETFGSSV